MTRFIIDDCFKTLFKLIRLMYKIRAKITNFTSTFIYFVFTQLTTLQVFTIIFYSVFAYFTTTFPTNTLSYIMFIK
jgi:hypothetical protein